MKKRTVHNLSHYKLLSANMGGLYPIGCTEVLPGDTFQHGTSVLLRCSPLLAPVMHPVRVRIHHWFVPTRIIWSEFENFITGGPDGLNASVPPYVTSPVSTGFAEGSLADYLGIRPGVASTQFSALPFRAYAKIFNEFYRDEDLTTALTISTASGSDTTTSVALQNACWEKDYFTSARLSAQKGSAVSIPLTGDAPVKGIGKNNQTFDAGSHNVYESGGSGTVNYPNSAEINTTANRLFYVNQDGTTGYPDIYADLSGVSAVDITDLREASAIQRYKEMRMRFGSRYSEYLLAMGIKSSDARLQRPEYLGGGKQTIQFSEIIQTGVTTDGDDQEGVGNLKGHGIAALRSNRYRKFFEEHGFVITLMSVLPKTMYQDQTSKMWNRPTKYDYWQPEYEHVGQQAVLYKEVQAQHTTPTAVFGYQDRYDEYRRVESSIAGEFRTTLNFWHMARSFSSDVALNSAFVTSNPTDRIFAVPSEDTLWIMANHSLRARRGLSKYGSSFLR